MVCNRWPIQAGFGLSGESSRVPRPCLTVCARQGGDFDFEQVNEINIPTLSQRTRQGLGHVWRVGPAFRHDSRMGCPTFRPILAKGENISSLLRNLDAGESGSDNRSMGHLSPERAIKFALVAWLAVFVFVASFCAGCSFSFESNHTGRRFAAFPRCRESWSHADKRSLDNFA